MFFGLYMIQSFKSLPCRLIFCWSDQMGMCRTEMVGGGEAYMMNGFDDDDSIMFEEDVFGKIEDLLDFSIVDMQLLLEPEQMTTTYDDATHLGNPDRFDDFPPVPNSIVAHDGGSGGSGEVKEDDSAFKCGDIDAAELEWVANFEEASLSPATIDVLPKSNDVVISNVIDGISSEGNNGDILHYRTPSPVSVLEHNGRLIIRGGMGGHGGGSFSSSSSSSPTSSSSCSSISNGIKALAPASLAETVVTRGRAPRTKRPRPPSIPRSNVLLPVASSSYDELLMIPSANYDSEHFAESNPIITSEFQEDQAAAFVDDDHNQNKKKKIKIMTSASTIKIIRSDDENQPASVRKCMHCEITKTPQWRAGPMGPKTLCNACGVRYKSGRLFPEYRPAASPTFVASQHSNSHKKVVEMRVKSTQKVSVPITPSLPVSAKGCELLNYIKSN